MISYKPLLKLMIDKSTNKTVLRNELGFSSSTMAKLNKNEYVSLSVIDKLCAYFNCQPSDLIEYIPSENNG
ncbi:helix-turn-helix domain-containing protein [Bacillus cereus]|uniref:helix-turn-helix domain-containing protein n=1 Tax=Bacillus cereus TaxID=1396 RepID=UPI000BF5F24D|nr:helix-turn-helix transcriptional regulator [Bacillus cereus]PEW14647.1 XRE family transcriptional regulator [Bacillus cereus]